MMVLVHQLRFLLGLKMVLLNEKLAVQAVKLCLAPEMKLVEFETCFAWRRSNVELEHFLAE